MASCFQSQWLVVSITPIRKHRNGATVVKSGNRSIFASTKGLKSERSLKLRREISNGYSLVAGKDWRIHCRNSQNTYENDGQEPFPGQKTEAEKVVEKFFDSLNNRNESQLAALLTDDCCYEDALFDSPFKGRKVVSRFAARVMNAMGRHVKFKAVILPVDDQITADWTLNWKGNEIPYMMGFNWFQLDKEKGLISKIGSANEALSVKPGERILKVLKIISTTLDKSKSDVGAISASLPIIYRKMKQDSSLTDIAELVAELFKNNDGNSPI